jgi:hypothetical protein
MRSVDVRLRGTAGAQGSPHPPGLLPYNVPPVSWRAATDLRRLPTTEWLLDQMDASLGPSDPALVVTAAAWMVAGTDRWDDPPSIPVIVTHQRLVTGRRRGRVGRRAEIRQWNIGDLTLRRQRPLHSDAAFTVLELDHWIEGTVGLVFVSPAEAGVVASLVAPGGR